jgi:hypothetical protein
MVCLRNISVDTLHKGDTEDDDSSSSSSSSSNNHQVATCELSERRWLLWLRCNINQLLWLGHATAVFTLHPSTRWNLTPIFHSSNPCAAAKLIQQAEVIVKHSRPTSLLERSTKSNQHLRIWSFRSTKDSKPRDDASTRTPFCTRHWPKSDKTICDTSISSA